MDNLERGGLHLFDAATATQAGRPPVTTNERIDRLLRRHKAMKENDVGYLRWELSRPVRVPKGAVTEAYRNGYERTFK